VTDGNPACLSAHEAGRESLCQQAYRENVQLAIDAQQILLFKCQARLCYFVIPLALSNGLSYAMIGGHSFVSEADVLTFKQEAVSWGISPSELNHVLVKNPLGTEESLRSTARDLQRIAVPLLENAHQSKENGSKTAYLSTLTNIARQFRSDLSEASPHTTLLNTLSILYDLKSACVFQQAPEKESYRGIFAIGRKAEELERSEVFLEHFLKNGKREDRSVFIRETSDLEKAGLPSGSSSCILFPLSEGSGKKMSLAILDTFLSEEDTRIIASFCLQTASFLENMILRDQIESQKKNIASLSALALVDDKLKASAFYAELLEQATRLLGAEKGSLMVKQESEQRLSVKAMTGTHPMLFSLFNKQPGEGVSGRVWQSGEALLVKDIAKDKRVAKPPRTRYKTDSFVSVPLKMTSQNMGVVNVSDRKDGQNFTEEDLSLLESMGRIMSIAIDRAQLQEKTEALRELSITDSLTGLLSRRYFEERLEREVERTRRTGFSTCLVMVDIDDFKRINDTFGHPMGDKVLRRIANAIRKTLRAIDVAFRYGGEEFALILPHTSKDDARVISERVCLNIAERRGLQGSLPDEMGLTISAGLASFPEDAATISELVQNADTALYEAKARGKNQVSIYRKKPYDFRKDA